MERGGDLQSLMAEFGVYRRAEVEHFVTWARSTILRLRELADDSVGRAIAAEDRAVAAEARAAAAEAEVAGERSARLAVERTLASRDRDMQATLGKALLLAQETIDVAAARAVELVAEARAEVGRIKSGTIPSTSTGHEFRFDPGPPPVLWDQDAAAGGIWAMNDDDPVLTPLRSARASGE